MFPALPKHHPPLKGCLNTLTFTEVSVSIFDSWGPGAASTFNCSKVFSYTDEDMAFVSSMKPEFSRRSSDLIPYLPLDVQKWFNECITGSWVYLIKGKSRESKYAGAQEFAFFFQHEDDLMLFKLSW